MQSSAVLSCQGDAFLRAEKCGREPRTSVEFSKKIAASHGVNHLVLYYKVSNPRGRGVLYFSILGGLVRPPLAIPAYK